MMNEKKSERKKQSSNLFDLFEKYENIDNSWTIS